VSLVVVLLIVIAAFAYFYVTSSATIGGLQSSTASLESQVASINSVTSEQESSILSLGGFASQQSSTIASLSGDISAQSSTITSLEATLSSQSSQIVGLNGQVGSLNGQVSNLQSQISAQDDEISTLQTELKSPTLSIWNRAQSMQPGYFLYEGVPDTFDYSDVWTSSSPITVYYLSVTQGTQYFNCGAASAITCVSGTYYYNGPTTSANDVFKLAEACGAYVAIYQPQSTSTTVTLYPNISITYNPAPALTGACA
jgi:uncharacterized coiled-coil protein SlyX